MDVTEILSFNIPSIETVGRQLTLDYVPADEETAELVNAQGSLTDLPAYMLDFRPILMLNSIIIAVGDESTFGTNQELQITITTPNQQDIVTSPLDVGNYYALAFDLGDMPAENVERVFNNTLEGLVEDNTMVMDHSVGGYMSLSLLNYFAMVDMQNQKLGESMSLRWWRSSPAVAVFGTTFDTAYGGNIPSAITPGFSQIDVVRNVLSVQGNKSLRKAFTLMSGGVSSSWESQGFDLFYNATGTSTVNIFEIATKEGIPIYYISSSNVNKLDELNIPTDAKEAILSSVNQGLDVYVPAQTLTIGNWAGIGWLAVDPTTGANAWMIRNALGVIINGGRGDVDLGKEYYEPEHPNSVDNYNQNYQENDGDELKQDLSRYGNKIVDTTADNWELGMGASSFMINSARFKSTAESISQKETYYSKRGEAGAYKTWSNRFGRLTTKGKEYLGKSKASSTAAKNAYSSSKKLESISSKAGKVANKLTVLAAGMTVHETIKNVENDLKNNQYNNAVIDSLAGAGKYGVIAGSFLAMGAIGAAGLAAAPAIAAGALVVGVAYGANKVIDHWAETKKTGKSFWSW